MTNVDDLFRPRIYPAPGQDFNDWWEETGKNHYPKDSLRRRIGFLLDRLSPSSVRLAMQTWFQRARKGYSTRDTWSFNHYLASVIAGGVDEIRADIHSHPVYVCVQDPGADDHAHCDGEQRWGEILFEISEGFTLLSKDISVYTEEQLEKIENAKQLFVKHFNAICD